MRLMLSIITAVFLVWSVACEDKDDGGGPSDPTDVQTTDEGSTTQTCTCTGSQYCSDGKCVDPADTCDLIAYDKESEAVYTRVIAGKNRLYYVTTNLREEVPFDKLTIELDHDKFFSGDPKPGTFDLATIDPTTSGLSVRAFNYCNEFECFNEFVADKGSLELTNLGDPGTRFTARLVGVNFGQVRYNSKTGALDPFPQGKTWCFGDYSMDVDVPELSQAQGSCVDVGTGMNIGDNIKDFQLTNCYGDPSNLHDRCGSTKVVWIVKTAGWCGACASFVPKVGQRYKEDADKGLDIMIIIGEDGARKAPTLEYCMQYAEEKGINPEQAFIDHRWQTLETNLNDYNATGIPWSALLDGASMTYTWSSSTGGNDLNTEIDEMLLK